MTLSDDLRKQKRREYVRANKATVYGASKRWQERNREQWLRLSRKANSAYKERLKAELVAAYGGCCACCGETEIDFLTLDHVGGGGGKERKELGWRGAGASMYLRLKKLGFPKDKYRVLCMNCNFATRHGRPCPHERESGPELVQSVLKGLAC